MFEKQDGRWAGVVAAALLLVLCTLLVWGTQTVLATNPLPPSPASQPPGTNTAYSPHPAASPHGGDRSVYSPPTMGAQMPSLSSLRAGGDREGGPPSVLSENDLVRDAIAGSVPGIQQLNPGFTVDLAYGAVWGVVDAGDLLTATSTAGPAYAAGEADGVGFAWSYFWKADGTPSDIGAGDTIDLGDGDSTVFGGAGDDSSGGGDGASNAVPAAVAVGHRQGDGVQPGVVDVRRRGVVR